MKIEHQPHKTDGLFVAVEDENIIGKLVYKVQSDHVLDFTDTGVNPEFRGKGVAKQLVIAAAEYAKQNGFKVIATCPYVKRVLPRIQEYKDLLV